LAVDLMAAARQCQASKEPIDPQIVALLQVPLCRLTKMLVPNAHTKMDEIVYAADHNLELNSATHGHDLRDKQGNHIERKVSVCTTRANYCNFNWNIPQAPTLEERRKKLLESIKEKTQGGFASLEVTDGDGRRLAEFTLCEGFLLEYFARITIEKSNNHNMGCSRCKTCHKFHRLEKLQAASNGYPIDFMSEDEWVVFMKHTPSQCEKKKKKK